MVSRKISYFFVFTFGRYTDAKEYRLYSFCRIRTKSDRALERVFQRNALEFVELINSVLQCTRNKEIPYTFLYDIQSGK